MVYKWKFSNNAIFCGNFSTIRFLWKLKKNVEILIKANFCVSFPKKQNLVEICNTANLCEIVPTKQNIGETFPKSFFFFLPNQSFVEMF